jgi:hypothetical protein
MSTKTRRFVRHYAEMVVAMFAGMGLLIPLLIGVLAVFGLGMHDSDTLMLGSMAVAMTVPMVAWMRFRGHAWAPCADMAAAMLVPTFGILLLLWSSTVEDVGTLMVAEHVVMLPSMLAAMLLRREVYTGAHA